MKKKKEIETDEAVIKQYSYTKKAYDDMLELCYGAKTVNSYAGRGIQVCDTWKDNCEVFMAEMKYRPDGATLERHDKNKGFNKDNCYWKIIKIKSVLNTQ